jgi:hypothetical protein
MINLLFLELFFIISSQVFIFFDLQGNVKVKPRNKKIIYRAVSNSKNIISNNDVIDSSVVSFDKNTQLTPVKDFDKESKKLINEPFVKKETLETEKHIVQKTQFTNIPLQELLLFIEKTAQVFYEYGHIYSYFIYNERFFESESLINKDQKINLINEMVVFLNTLAGFATSSIKKNNSSEETAHYFWTTLEKKIESKFSPISFSDDVIEVQKTNKGVEIKIIPNMQPKSIEFSEFMHDNNFFINNIKTVESIVVCHMLAQELQQKKTLNIEAIISHIVPIEKNKKQEIKKNIISAIQKGDLLFKTFMSFFKKMMQNKHFQEKFHMLEYKLAHSNNNSVKTSYNNKMSLGKKILLITGGTVLTAATVGLFLKYKGVTGIMQAASQFISHKKMQINNFAQEGVSEFQKQSTFEKIIKFTQFSGANFTGNIIDNVIKPSFIHNSGWYYFAYELYGKPMIMNAVKSIMGQNVLTDQTNFLMWAGTAIAKKIYSFKIYAPYIVSEGYVLAISKKIDKSKDIFNECFGVIEFNQDRIIKPLTILNTVLSFVDKGLEYRRKTFKDETGLEKNSKEGQEYERKQKIIEGMMKDELADSEKIKAEIGELENIRKNSLGNEYKKSKIEELFEDKLRVNQHVKGEKKSFDKAYVSYIDNQKKALKEVESLIKQKGVDVKKVDQVIDTIDNAFSPGLKTDLKAIRDLYVKSDSKNKSIEDFKEQYKQNEFKSIKNATQDFNTTVRKNNESIINKSSSLAKKIKDSLNQNALEEKAKNIWAVDNSNNINS